MMRLQDSVAVVTGAGSGIGRAIALLFAQEGARTVVADKAGDRARETVAHIASNGGIALATVTDVTSKADVEQMALQTLNAFGKVDILVNNAGASFGDNILKVDEDAWDRCIAVVLKSVYLCSKALLPYMIERRQGSIVNIASVNGLMALGEEPYSAGKAGMINLTQNMAVKYGPAGIRANCVCPGTIRTPIWEKEIAQDPQIFERLVKWYPLGRVGEPEDIARAVLFLSSRDGAWITGITLPVDGGLMAGNYRMTRELVGEGGEE